MSDQVTMTAARARAIAALVDRFAAGEYDQHALVKHFDGSLVEVEVNPYAPFQRRSFIVDPAGAVTEYDVETDAFVEVDLGSGVA